MEQQQIKISKLKNNVGQIQGLPKNPRKISSFAKGELRRSIVESPEISEWKMLLVFPFEGNFVAIAGNQRLTLYRELKYKDVLCIVLPADTTVEKLKEYTLKDNHNSGTWAFDELAENWPEAGGFGIWEKEPEQEKTEKVSFNANKDLVITVKFDSEAAREVLFERLQKEGFEVWYGKRKPK